MSVLQRESIRHEDRTEVKCKEQEGVSACDARGQRV